MTGDGCVWKGLIFCIWQEGTWLPEHRGCSIPPHVIAEGQIKELSSREKRFLWVEQAWWAQQWGDTCPELEEAARVSGCSWTELFTLFSRLLLLMSLLVFLLLLFPGNCFYLNLWSLHFVPLVLLSNGLSVHGSELKWRPRGCSQLVPCHLQQFPELQLRLKARWASKEFWVLRF